MTYLSLPDLRSARDPQPAHSMLSALRTPPGSGDWTVDCLVPPTFEAYARVLHPSDHSTWAEIAAANGQVLRPDSEFGEICVPADEPPLRWFDKPLAYQTPSPNLRPAAWKALAVALAAHTASADDVWFGIWEGREDRSANAPRFTYGTQSHLLYHGRLTGVDEWDLGDQPDLFWPDDEAWFVGSEIDDPADFVGGSRATIDAILGLSELEAFETTANARAFKVYRGET